MEEQRNVIDDYFSNKENRQKLQDFGIKLATTAVALGMVQTVYQIGTIVN